MNKKSQKEISKFESRFFWLKKAADFDDVSACLKVDEMYAYGIGTEQDDKKAFDYYKKAADFDVVSACLKVAEMYAYGIGTEQDDKKAFDYYKKAADFDVVSACIRVAKMYAYGIGTEQDDKKAFDYYQKYKSEAKNIDAFKYFAKNAPNDKLKFYWLKKTFDYYKKAFDNYKKAADFGDVSACIRVAEMYAHGIGTEQDDKNAIDYYQKYKSEAKDIDAFKYFAENAPNDKFKFHWLKKIADFGDVSACIRVAEMYAHGIGIEQDNKKAFDYYKKAADFGDVSACLRVAEMYVHGIGIEQDNKKAFDYYKKAADFGDVSACIRVAEMFAYGIGTEQDNENAVAYYKKFKSSVATDIDAFEYFAENAPNDKFKFHWLKKIADFGDVSACIRVAEMYAHGIGTEQDNKKAFDYYKKAADFGDVSACIRVAEMYAHGIGTEQDDKNAIDYYQKYKSEAKDIDAFKYFAENAPNDKLKFYWLKKTFDYYKKAADFGNVSACLKVAEMYAHGIGTEQDNKKAFDYYKKAADFGDVSACIRVAEMYAHGIGIEQDNKKAFDYYKKAADFGNISAGLKVAKMFAYGIGTEQDNENAVAYYKKFKSSVATDIDAFEYFAENAPNDKFKFHWLKKIAFFGR